MIRVLGLSERLLTLELSQENYEIYHLRQGNKPLGDIAGIINKARFAAVRPSRISGDAVYGRYKRNNRLIAAVRGEIFKPCKIDGGN